MFSPRKVEWASGASPAGSGWQVLCRGGKGACARSGEGCGSLGVVEEPFSPYQALC
jgi:hypothetical protein